MGCCTTRRVAGCILIVLVCVAILSLVLLATSSPDFLHSAVYVYTKPLHGARIGLGAYASNRAVRHVLYKIIERAPFFSYIVNFENFHVPWLAE